MPESIEVSRKNLSTDIRAAIENSLYNFMRAHPHWLDDVDWDNPLSLYRFLLPVNEAGIEIDKLIARAKVIDDCTS